MQTYSHTVLDSILQSDTILRHSPFYFEGVSGVPSGVVGEPLEYSVSTDSYIVVGLLLCIVFTVFALMRSWPFTSYQLRDLFRTPRENSFEMRETERWASPLRYFWLQAIVLVGIVLMSLPYQVPLGIYGGNYVLMGVGILSALAFVLIKEILYGMVLPVFFERGKRHLFKVIRLFVGALFGLLMLPITILHIYTQLGTELTILLVVSAFVITFLLQIYKVYCVFFSKNGNFLRFFLYLCTLEAVPVALFGGILLFIANYLKINI